MPTRNGIRRRLSLLPVAALVLVALPVATSAAQAPGLPRTFNAQTIDSPAPRDGGSFGWGIASADLTGDGKLDLLVAQSQDPTQTGVFVFDGATGAHIDTIRPPELNPGGSDPILAFVYVETMPDIGSCPGGDGNDADAICDAAAVGEPDGIPEIIVGSRSKRVNADDPSIEATNDDPALGRGYIIDGKTRAVLKRVDMPKADRIAQKTLEAGSHFGRVMASPQSMAPCAGSAAENNNNGVGPCPATPLASRIGDLNGDGVADIVVTARNFAETPAQAVAGSVCAESSVASCRSGKAWAYSGKIAGTDPKAILDEALYAMQNPLSQTSSGEFGGNLYRLGDVDTDVTKVDCFATPGAASCAPEFTIAARNMDYPLGSPGIGFDNVGAAFVFKGATGAIHQTRSGTVAVTHPEVQKLTQFSGSFNGGRAVGDLGASTAPDILLPAALQNARKTDDGKIWAFNAVGGGGGASGSWQFASMTDPTPEVGGNFGGAFTGVGNLVDGPSAPANELLVGGFRFDPFTEAANNVLADLHFVNIQTGTNLMTIPHPDGVRGDGFGVGLIPMGDLNRDGFIDFASSAYIADVEIDGVSYGGGGRAWIFRSDNSAPPAPPTAPAPVVTGPAAPPAAPAAGPPAAAADVALAPGDCVNRTIGTDNGERIRGTIAGDEIFGFGGNDSISGFQGVDCIDGGKGNDRLYGGDDNDTLVGGSGADRLDGNDERDKLYGGTGNDRLRGGHGRDLLAGGPGNDGLYGGPDADRLFGESGKDRLVGSGGRDVIDGGAGNDSIDARDGERDRIICGRGRDRVRADSYDRLNGCEIVTFGGKIKYRSTLPKKATRSTQRSTSTTSRGTKR